MNANDPGSNSGPNLGHPDDNQQDGLLALIHHTAFDHLLHGKNPAEALLDHTALERVLKGENQAEAVKSNNLARSSRQAYPIFSKAMIEESMKNTPMKTFIRLHTNADIQEAVLRRDMIARQKLGGLYHKLKQGDWVTIITRSKLPNDAQARSKSLCGGERRWTAGKTKNKLQNYCEACKDWVFDFNRHVAEQHIPDPDKCAVVICRYCQVPLGGCSDKLSHKLKKKIRAHYEKHSEWVAMQHQI